MPVDFFIAFVRNLSTCDSLNRPPSMVAVITSLLVDIGVGVLAVVVDFSVMACGLIGLLFPFFD